MSAFPGPNGFPRPFRSMQASCSQWVFVGLGAMGLLSLCLGLIWLTVDSITPPASAGLIEGARSPTAAMASIVLTSSAPSQTPPVALATATRRATPTGMTLPPPEVDTRQASDGVLLIRVPAGPFLRGASAENRAAMQHLCPACLLSDGTDQSPQRMITLDEFWIDATEVTNARFARFVAETGYVTTAEQHGSSYVFNTSRDDFDYVGGANWRQPRGPGSSLEGRDLVAVTQISWIDADAYCRWAGRRLPNEAEWEKAARGAEGILFPWGNGAPRADQLNFGWANPGPVVTGQYPAGASPYGVLDMAGNVWEWTADWYDPTYYASAPDQNPAGPVTGTLRVFRGGSWASSPTNGLTYVMTTYRLTNYPTIRSDVLGIRCAADSDAMAAVPTVAGGSNSVTSTPVSATPTGCASPPTGLFAGLWQRHTTELGCPNRAQPTRIQDAEQPFQNGHMFWRADRDVYIVVYDGGGVTRGSWVQYPSNYNTGGLATCTESAPSGLVKPVRGFGDVWCGLGGATAEIGWGLDQERGFGAGQGTITIQDFDGGILFQDSDGAARGLAYVLLNDGQFIRQPVMGP